MDSDSELEPVEEVKRL